MASQQPSTPQVPKYLKTKEMITDYRRAEGRIHLLLHIHGEVMEDLKLLKSSVSKELWITNTSLLVKQKKVPTGNLFPHEADTGQTPREMVERLQE